MRMKRLVFAALLAIVSAGAVIGTTNRPAAQAPQTSSSAESSGVRVYTPQGYYVKAKNSNDYACEYSYTYEVIGYNGKGEVVSTTEESTTGSTLEAKEERTLFTAPSDPKRETAYIVKITGVSDVKKIG